MSGVREQLVWPERHRVRAFEARFVRSVQDIQFRLLEDLVPSENRMSYSHGGGWGFRREDASVHVGEFQRASSSKTVSFERLVDNDLTLIRELIMAMAGDLARQMMSRAFEVITEGVESVGNTVSAKESGSLALAFRDALKKIEFGVDASGNVAAPRMHAPPAIQQQLVAEWERQSPEFKEEVEHIIKGKVEAALEEERLRLGRYKTTSPAQ